MAGKKPTNKEIVAKVEMLNRVNTTVIQMIETVGTIIKQYVEFKGDTQDFHEYQKEILNARKKIIKSK